MAPAGHDLADPRAYRRLAAMIRQQIGDGTLQSGRAAPSITSLSREHGNARQTCSRALRMLEGEGMLSSDRAGCDTVTCLWGWVPDSNASPRPIGLPSWQPDR